MCIPEKYARWLQVQLNKVKKEENILGEQYIECNPFNPCWDDGHLMTEEVKARRKPRHVKKILDQWYECAKRSQSEAIRNSYSQLLVRVAETGKHLWEHLVFKIEVDSTLTTFPKVYRTEAEVDQKAKSRANKRSAGGQDGPATKTLMSAARKRKGRKRKNDGNDMEDRSDRDTFVEDDDGRGDGRSMAPRIGG